MGSGCSLSGPGKPFTFPEKNSEESGQPGPHIVDPGRDDIPRVDIEEREYEDEIQDCPDQASEVRKRRYEDYPEERDLCHLGERLGLVDLPEVREGWFSHACFYVRGDPSGMQHRVERGHPRHKEAGEGGVRMPPGKEGEDCGERAVNDHPEQEGIEKDVPADARKSNCGKQEREEEGDDKPEDFCPRE